MLKIGENVSDLIFFTGNVLNMSEIKRKLGAMTATDEILSALRITSRDHKLDSKDAVINFYSNAGLYPTVVEDPKELITGVKVFVPVANTKHLRDAVHKVLTYLELKYIDSVVLARPGEDLALLMTAWKELENMVNEGKIQRIGVSDMETDVFIELYNKAEIKPNIVQINLSICCIVPPELQDFTKKNEIQLLTHNDPKENILPTDALNEIIGECFEGPKREVETTWTARFQTHVKCRGVLTTKGYVVGVTLKE